MAQDLVLDPAPLTADGAARLTTWYAQGHSDALGDRLLMFDNTTGPSWEILRFRPTLGRDPRFEAAVCRQVQRLGSFRHQAFPIVRPIKELGDDHELAVVSTYTSGACVADALRKRRSAAFAALLVRELVPALAALQQHGIAHGALTVDRIVVVADGRLMIRDHMVGPAIESLGLSATKLWADFGILASPVRLTAPLLDARSDVVQLALVALSLMAGRRVGPDEYPERMRELFEEIALANRAYPPALFQALRRWLERALQLDDRPFASAQEALGALADLGDPAEGRDDYFQSTTRGVAPRLIAPTPLPERPPAFAASAPQDRPDAPEASRVDAAARTRPRFGGALRWVAIGVGVVALAEAAFIARMLWSRSEARAVTTANQAAGNQAVVSGSSPTTANETAVSSLSISVDANQGDRARTPPARGVAGEVNDRIGRALATAPVAPEGEAIPASTNREQRGGFRLSSPVQLHVLDGDRVIGSSDTGPIVAAAGRREFDFVNSAIGYRVRRVVDIKAGQIASLSIDVPMGTLNVNAVPWASVWIDGKPVGETPLGNLALVPGEHEVVFRHPELGERRERTIVRADTPTRVSVNLQK